MVSSVKTSKIEQRLIRNGNSLFWILPIAIVIFTWIVITGIVQTYREYTWIPVNAQIIAQHEHKTAKSGVRYRVTLRTDIKRKRIIFYDNNSNGPYKIGTKVRAFYNGKDEKTFFWDSSPERTRIELIIVLALDIIVIYSLVTYIKYKIYYHKYSNKSKGW